MVVALVVAALCVRLGVWQLERLNQRQERNREVSARLALPPIVLGPGVAEDSIRYRRVLARGVFDFAREVVAVGRSANGVPGVYVVTPLVAGDSAAVLVERGWAPSADARNVDLASVRERDSSQVEGVLLPVTPATTPPVSHSTWPRYVLNPDPIALRGSYPYHVLGLVLRRTEARGASPGALTAIPLPELGNGPHLSYAIQWFAFAAIAVVGTAVLVARSKQ